MSCHLECNEGSASKFWSCVVKGDQTTVTFGKIGTPGNTQSKTHKDAAAATKFFEKLKKEKMGKGYVEKGRAKAKAKGKSTSSPVKRAAEAAPSGSPKLKKSKSSESVPAPSPPPKMKKSKSSELLENAKKAASTGGNKKAGGRAVDPRAPNAASLKVVDDYAVKLNQTHIDANNNKFYIIQVLEGSGKYYAWNRWGRVGEDGQNSMKPCPTLDAAIKDFESKFKAKTSNNWANKDSFKPVNGKYIIVETEDASGGQQESAPMGKLTEAQIGKGQKVLEKLGAALQKGSSQAELEKMSSEFYSLVPHNFGRNRPPAISTNEMLQGKVELLKFYLRMGFEVDEEEKGATPISGVMNMPVPASLTEAASGLCSKGDIDKSDKKGADFAKTQAGKPTKTMAAKLYGAIMLYTSNAIYQDLNKSLRDENRAKIKRYFKYLRLFFESMDHLPKQKRQLWRGLSVDLHDNPQYKVGSTVTWWGVSSTTADINVAKNFAKGCGGNCTVITLETKTATDISAITFYSNEKECLLSPGTQLKVKSNKRVGKVTEITVEEVGRAIG